MIEAIVLYIFGIALGIFIGIYISRWLLPKIGTLRMDRSDPDGPYLFLELSEDPKILGEYKEVRLDVKLEDYPQK